MLKPSPIFNYHLLIHYLLKKYIAHPIWPMADLYKALKLWSRFTQNYLNMRYLLLASRSSYDSCNNNGIIECPKHFTFQTITYISCRVTRCALAKHSIIQSLLWQQMLWWRITNHHAHIESPINICPTHKLTHWPLGYWHVIIYIYIIFSLILVTGGKWIFCEIALRWLAQVLTDYKLMLFQVMT